MTSNNQESWDAPTDSMNGRVESVEICINAICIDNIPARNDQMHKTSSNGHIHCVKNTFDWRLTCDGRDHWNVVNFDYEHVSKAWSTPSCNHQAICCFTSYFMASC